MAVDWKCSPPEHSTIPLARNPTQTTQPKGQNTTNKAKISHNLIALFFSILHGRNLHLIVISNVRYFCPSTYKASQVSDGIFHLK